MKRSVRIFLSAVLPVLLLIAAGVLGWIIIRTGPEPEKAPPAARGVLVKTMAAAKKVHRLDVAGKGTVSADRRVVLYPQVTGRVVSLHTNYWPGGIIDEGVAVARIEPDDYEIALRQAENELTTAESALRLEEGRQVVAQRDWQISDVSELPDSNRELALRAPQLRAAEAAVKQAEARVALAELNLERTVIRAPFNGVLLSDPAEIGMLVTPASPIAVLAGTDRFRVDVEIPADKLPYISIPGVNAQTGSAVTVRLDTGRGEVTRRGHVLALHTDVKRNARLARVLCTVEDLLVRDSSTISENNVPVLLGSYVDVEIQGIKEEPLIAIPWRAVRDGNKAWIFNDGRLVIRELDIAWRRPSEVLVRAGIQEGEQVITSRLAVPVENMKLRISGSENGGRNEDHDG